ncbi:MAG TPA: magnesium chelatase [Firmicutes bacterium]|nr:magnesium chelatase [Bacillota bacterium]
MRAYTSLVRHEGNRELFLLTELSIIGLCSGQPIHIHVEGLRGTGKTTILRAARWILPPITRIKGCPYNCDPSAPHCPLHAGLTAEQIAALGTELIPTPFLEISHSAKIGTVVGTLDLKRLTDINHPEAALLPGTLPKAHRGIVFIDEINRLADTAPELTDILLDVMGTKPGLIQIEESGLPSVTLPVQVTVWAASNPDEDPGPLTDIRRQLSDRFDFVARMGRPVAPREILHILDNEMKVAPGECLNQDRDRALSLQSAATKVDDLVMEDTILPTLAELYLRHHLESLRGVVALKLGALLHAAWRGADVVEWSDVAAVAPAALRHRVRPEELQEILASLEQAFPPAATEAAGVLAHASAGTRPPGGPNSKEVAKSAGWNPRTRWWQSLRDRWRRFLTATGARRPGQSPSRGTVSSQSKAEFPNPLDLPLVSPPQPARPLPELDLPEAITPAQSEDGIQHGE